MKKQNQENIIQVLADAKIDLSKPVEIRSFFQNMPVNEVAAYFPDTISRLVASGIHRELDKNIAKLAKVGTEEYSKYVMNFFTLWETTPYLTAAEEKKATRPAIQQKGAARTKLPFSKEDILERVALLSPSGNSAKAKRVKQVITQLADFSEQAFIAYYIKSMENSESLLSVAIKELTQEQAARAAKQLDELVGDVESI